MTRQPIMPADIRALHERLSEIAVLPIFYRTIETYMREAITPTEYKGFQKAYDFFNAELFGGALPHVLVTLQRHAKAKGYLAPDRFTGRAGRKTTAHELALNPDQFTGCTDEEILSTLAHERAHVWQQTQGEPPTRCYHDREWAAKMKEIGLQPTSTGKPGGKETGQSVTHIIVPGGPYARAYAKLKATGFQLHWQSAPETEQAKAKRASKTKFTCPECGQNAWAKPDALLICGNCHEDGEGDIVHMLAEPPEED
jgi:predicted SprT family Zn-dependent metalloprotease